MPNVTGWVDERIAKASLVVVNAVMDRMETKLDTAIDEVKGEIMNLDNKIVSLSTRMIGTVDSLDGKMGNLHEQLAELPGQVITSTANAVREAIESFNPFRPR
jgi:hypothetical protein